ncbi:MAG: hypothetical protein GY743_21590 [Planctomycetaceae bacterium]|nr:hypothetical protein [Planctomycetaceae bacterium]
MTHSTHSRDHNLIHRILIAAGLLVVSAIAVTWSWNTIVPELSGLARIRFVEGFSITLTVLLLGTLFEAGRRLISSPVFEDRKS